tara:strand:+ start:204 stop:857 length:654 start_codon:yes stop_codon:yes gene_type:complete
VRSFLQALAVVAIINALGVYLIVSSRTPDVIDQQVALETIFGGKENIDIISAAESIEVFKLDARLIFEFDREGLETLGFETVYGYPIVQGPQPAEAILAEILREDISNPALYTHIGAVSMCIFQPDYLIRFRKNASEVDLLISFAHCPEIRVYSNGKQIEYEEVEIGEGNFVRKVYPGFGNFDRDPKRVHHALEFFFPLWGGKEETVNQLVESTVGS